MNTKPVRKHYDWHRAKMAHCGCGKWALTVIFDCEPSCTACIDAHYTSALENHIDAQAARIAELETERDEFRRRFNLERQILEDADRDLASLRKELEALRAQPPIGYIDPDSLREYRGVKAGGSWSDKPKGGEYNQSLPIFAQPVPSAPVAVPDDFISAIAEVLRISDRDHDAWHRAKAALADLRLNSGSKPNKATIEAIKELESDGGQKSESADALFKELGVEDGNK